MASTAALAPVAGSPGMMCGSKNEHFLAMFNDNDVKRKALQSESFYAACASARRHRSQRNNSFLEQVKCHIHRGGKIGPEPGALLFVPSLCLDGFA
jgi:hypothetical protein